MQKIQHRLSMNNISDKRKHATDVQDMYNSNCSNKIAGIRRRYDVEIWLKIGRQRDINVILTSFCERWFNISIQTSKQRR